jgi:hypothetical protein
MIFYKLDRVEVEQYLENRRQLGFNTILAQFLAYGRFQANKAGEYPLLNENDLTTPNEKFFANVDWVIRKAAEKGMQVVIAPAWLDCCNGGWRDKMKANGVEKNRAFGLYIGKRYKDVPNLMWLMLGDRDPGEYLPFVDAMAEGIKAGGGKQLMSGHAGSPRSAREVLEGESWLDFNTTYTYWPNSTTTGRPQFHVYANSRKDYRGSDTRINGGRAQGVEYYIDGISATTGVGRNISQALAPNMDSVAEFKVITNGISAEYGRLSGGAVELVTKSGTNTIHGQVFNYLQNPVLNANTWINNRTNGCKQEYRQNNFGTALGGPLYLPRFGEGGPSVWKGTNRTFWFFNYDGLRNSEAGNSVLLSVPTAEERAGIFVNTRFNGVAADIFRMDSPVIPDPTPGSSEIVRTNRWLTGADDPRAACRNQQGRCLPINQISPVSSAILALLPAPNRAPENNSSFLNNFVGSRGNVTNSNQWALRLDHRFSDSQSIYGRFSRLNSNSERTPVSGYTFSRAQRQAVREGFGMTMGYNWQISPTLIFDAKIGGSHNPFQNGGFLASGFSSAGIPFDRVTRSYLGTSEFPGISIVGLGTLSDTWGENQSRNRNLSTYNATASMIKIMGKHTAKFGYEHRRYYDSFGTSSSSDFYFISSSVNRVVGDRSWQN